MLQNVMYDLPEHEGASTVVVRATDITGETTPVIASIPEQPEMSV